MSVMLPRALFALALFCSAPATVSSQCAGNPVSKSTYLKASVPGSGDSFGAALAVSGDTLVIGAPDEDSAAVGVGGDASDDSAPGAGAVYVYHRVGLFWNFTAYLKASNTDPGDAFGVAVSIDGDTIAVGAHLEDSSGGGPGAQSDNSKKDLGAVYVFRKVAGRWSQEAYLKPALGTREDHFGRSLSLDGDRLVVGAPGEDGVPGDPTSGAMPSSGAAYVFLRGGSSWFQTAFLKASNADAGDLFGSSVALDATRVYVGAPFEDSAAAGIGADPSDDSAVDAGAVYVFSRHSVGGWVQDEYLKASNTDPGDRFGSALAADGGRLVVGAPREDGSGNGISGDPASNDSLLAGAAYLFVNTPGGWLQEAYLKATNTGELDQFGDSVALWGNRALVGAHGERSSATGINGDGSDDSSLSAGAAYLFTRTSAQWTPTSYLKASNTEAKDFFGQSVALSDRLAVVGAPLEDSASPGVGGNQADNSAMQAGAAYGFVLPHSSAATVTVRRGTPMNPLAFFSGPSRPLIGLSWQPFVSHAAFAPGATLDLLLLRLGPAVNLPRPAGTLLCDPSAAGRLLAALPGHLFSLRIPDDCALIGTALCTQAASFTPGSGLELTNALDLVIGSI